MDLQAKTVRVIRYNAIQDTAINKLTILLLCVQEKEY